MGQPYRDLLSIDEAAAMTGVTRRTIHRWMNSGVLTPVAKFGGSPVFSRTDVEALVRPTSEEAAG